MMRLKYWYSIIPIFEDHLTVPLRWHEKQQIKPYYEDMLDIVSDLSDYALFYNGPKCGASAPDHMHFQVERRGVSGCEKLAELPETGRLGK